MAGLLLALPSLTKVLMKNLRIVRISSPHQLVLSLALGSLEKEQHFTPARTLE